MVTPNEEQVKFIKSKNNNVLVSASAGSGKTFTMIQKLINILIEERVPVTSLLVLTFTEAAASEIKQRLYNEIVNVLDTADEKSREFLQKQLDNINDAEIGTLHSVCKKLLIKYFYEINISPDFSILSEKEAKYLLDRSINEVFEKNILSNDEMFFELYDCYNSKRNDTNLKAIIIQLINYLNNKYNYKEWISRVTSDSFLRDLNQNQVCIYLLKYIKDSVFKFKDKIVELKNEAINYSLDKYYSFLDNRFQFTDEIVNVNNFVQLLKVLSNRSLVKKPGITKKSSVDEINFDEKVSVFNKSFGDSIKKIDELLISYNEDEILTNFESVYNHVEKLLSIVEEIKDLYNVFKKNKNTLDFNDLEDKMLELLKSDEIRKILKSHYKYIFFDEYQDINEKQEMILSHIVSGDNYYMIGDVKQSIYAFRQSSPKIFVDKFNKYQNDDTEDQVINFNKNYRSDRSILEFNNFIFDKLITNETIGIDYKANSRFDSVGEYDECKVDLKIIDTCVSEESEEDIDKDKKEILVICDTISNILTKTKKDGTRYTFKDIAIILRKRGSFLKSLCDTLQKMQIPISTTINNEFFDTFEINLLLSILKVVSNYKDDIALSIVLKNLFNLNECDLLKIRQLSDNKYFYECVENYSESDKIRESINNLFDFINQSRMEISHNTLREFLENTIKKFDIYEKIFSMPSGDRRVGNIDEFLSLIDNELYEYNIDKFIEYVDYISKDSSLQKIGITGNAVQICTIHYSKGLEYPAVIFAGLGKKFTLNKDTNDIIINENFGIGLKSIDNENRILRETLIRNACKIDNKRSEINEEIRLLYVAMTRPKEYLCLIGQYKIDNLQNINSKDVYLCKNYLDMILLAFGEKSINKFLHESEFVINEGGATVVNIKVYKCDELLDDENQELERDIIGGVYNELKEKLIEVYNNKPSLKTCTIKNTVTNILREESDYENLNYIPKTLDLNDEVVSKDYLKIGTAYHSIMQNLKFTESRQEIESLINNMLISNEITEDVAKDIKVSEIYNAKETLKDLILGADQVYREKQFVMQESYNKLVKNSDNNTKIIIQGIIDLVIVKNDEAILIDYKTNRTKDIEILQNIYSLQLQIYKKAFEKATNITINKTFLYSFYLNKLIEMN